MWRMCLSRNVQRKGTTNGNLGHQRTGSGIIHHAASIGNNIPSPQLSSALSDSELNVKLGASLRNPSSVTFKVAKRPMEGGGWWMPFDADACQRDAVHLRVR